MTRRPRGRVDPLEHEIERALSPGEFIPDGACFSFVSDLDQVAGRIAELIRSDRPAPSLYGRSSRAATRTRR
jgi:hypothetical protein